jgi:hypothetical protein
MCHKISIHKFGRSERPPQTIVAMNAPINVDPTNSSPAERALVALAC